jgi:hypothetical protein
MLDSGSEVNLLVETIYEGLIETGVEIPILPLESVTLVTAFGKCSNKVKKKAVVEFAIGRDLF